MSCLWQLGRPAMPEGIQKFLKIIAVITVMEFTSGRTRPVV